MNIIENPQAYNKAISRNIRRNALVGRIQRGLPPEILALIAVRNVEYREQQIARITKSHAEVYAYLASAEAGPDDYYGGSLEDRLAALRPHWDLDNPEGAGNQAQWIIDDASGSDHPFADKLIAGAIVYGKVSPKQMAWVTKLTSAIPAKAETRAAASAAEAARKAASVYVGTVKERRDFTLLVRFAVNIETDYGTSRLVSFTDPDDNEFVWFGSGAAIWDLERGETYTLTATIKEHKLYEGTEQTAINRAKIINTKEVTA